MQKSFFTRAVNVGTIGIGGHNPIRIQSMLNVSILDTKKALDQARKLSDAGCELLRITIPGLKEAMAVEKFKNMLIRQNINLPLIADIHFSPKAALTVVDFVEKIRINPGNYLDKRAVFQTLSYTEAQYQEELKRLEKGFLPLLKKLKKQKKALRIGVNHGSLSDRIMSRFGNTTQGMVESALEYGEICRNHDFHDLVFSMKASNPKIMVESYQKLVEKMQQKSWDYPLHLGVTEAGEGEDGRVKSAIGIGALLLDGIGDTIRVSLTEDPDKEIRPAKFLINYTRKYKTGFMKLLKEKKVDYLNKEFCNFSGDKEKITMEAAAAFGFLVFKNKASMVEIQTDSLKLQEKTDLKLSILQGLGLKRSKAEFISCPGCGRTQFDLQKAAQKVKRELAHLKDFKIAVMGCVVNGPGEMADSDFGLIGSGKDKVDLYIKQKCVEKGLELDDALKKLLGLIKTAKTAVLNKN